MSCIIARHFSHRCTFAENSSFECGHHTKENYMSMKKHKCLKSMYTIEATSSRSEAFNAINVLHFLIRIYKKIYL